jgi:Spy/CpxP family protein refolding chaperone
MTPAVETRPRTRRIAVLLLVGTFIAGALTGAGVLVLLGPPPPPPGGPGGLGPLTELDLTADQEAQARALHERHRPELEAIFKETQPKVRAVQLRIEAELRELLTPEQQRRLDAMEARRPAAGSPMPHPPGAPPPPGMPPPPH